MVVVSARPFGTDPGATGPTRGGGPVEVGASTLHEHDPLVGWDRPGALERREEQRHRLGRDERSLPGYRDLEHERGIRRQRARDQLATGVDTRRSGRARMPSPGPRSRRASGVVRGSWAGEQTLHVGPHRELRRSRLGCRVVLRVGDLGRTQRNCQLLIGPIRAILTGNSANRPSRGEKRKNREYHEEDLQSILESHESSEAFAYRFR